MPTIPSSATHALKFGRRERFHIAKNGGQILLIEAIAYRLYPTGTFRSEMGGDIEMTTPLRILVVEDYEPFRRFVCSALQQQPRFQVIEASDGLEALEKATELKPDVVLLDIGLPGLNGFEVARKIGKGAPDARLLFVSQESSSELVKEAFRLGAQGYVHKLRVQNDLLPAIEAALAGRTFVSDGLELPESGDAPAPFCHEILFCRNEDTLLNSLTSFFAAAIQAGNSAIGLVTDSHWDRLLRTLNAQGIDIDHAIQKGTVLSLNADEVPDPIRFSEAVQSASEAAKKAGKDHPRVAIWGERAGRLWSEGKKDEAILLERFGGDLAKSNEVDILCVYPFNNDQETDDALRHICAEHSAVFYE
jgi:CheY-like chemotaxis protein